MGSAWTDVDGVAGMEGRVRTVVFVVNQQEFFAHFGIDQTDAAGEAGLLSAVTRMARCAASSCNESGKRCWNVAGESALI